jgi:hypothetical protein
MPSLTVQAPDPVQVDSSSQPVAGPSGSGSTTTERRSRTADRAGESSGASQRDRLTGTAPSVRADRSGGEAGPRGGGVRGGGAGRGGAGRGGTRRDGPPEGRETAQLYPDLTVKTLAPRIDVTRREETRDVTHRATRTGGQRRERGGGADPGELADLYASGERGRARYPSDVGRVVEKLYREIERKTRIERERRGL